jgi:hypothetical protein
MKQEDVDKLWYKAMSQAMQQGELYTRYKFAELIAAEEREACALVCEQVTAAWSEMEYNEGCMDCSKAIRARGDA